MEQVCEGEDVETGPVPGLGRVHVRHSVHHLEKCDVMDNSGSPHLRNVEPGWLFLVLNLPL